MGLLLPLISSKSISSLFGHLALSYYTPMAPFDLETYYEASCFHYREDDILITL